MLHVCCHTHKHTLTLSHTHACIHTNNNNNQLHTLTIIHHNSNSTRLSGERAAACAQTRIRLGSTLSHIQFHNISRRHHDAWCHCKNAFVVVLSLFLTHFFLVLLFVECLSLFFFIPFRTPFCRQRTHVFRSGLACILSCIDPILNLYFSLPLVIPYRTSPMEVSVTKHTAQIWAAVNQRVSSGVDLPISTLLLISLLSFSLCSFCRFHYRGRQTRSDGWRWSARL